ncbi:hypothetical protein D3C76_1383990 [compost metagenome]
MPGAIVVFSFRQRVAGVTEQLIDCRKRSRIALIFEVTNSHTRDRDAGFDQRVDAVAQALLLCIEAA